MIWLTHPGLFLLKDGLIMATFGYRPATITALINFSLSGKGSEKKPRKKNKTKGRVTSKLLLLLFRLVLRSVERSLKDLKLPELTLDLGSLGLGLLTKPACIKCSAN